MNRIVVALALSLGLTGCAAQPKQVLSEDGYLYYAKPLMMVGMCSHQGFISPELAASGIRHIRAGVDQTAYDENKLTSMAGRMAQNNAPPTQGDCNDLALQISQVTQQRAANIAQSQANAQEQQALMNQLSTAVPKPIYCNKIGTQTLCN